MTEPDTDTLETLFQQARATPPHMPAGMMDRMIADALAAQPAPAARGWRAIWQAIGGAPALGGLVTATAVGFWIGIAPPAGVPDIAALISSGEIYTTTSDAASLELGAPELTAFGWDIDEG